ncbi:hypothetical protein V8C86DRAFT_2496571 [Haematococcus lacustris]
MLHPTQGSKQLRPPPTCTSPPPSITSWPPHLATLLDRRGLQHPAPAPRPTAQHPLHTPAHPPSPHPAQADQTLTPSPTQTGGLLQQQQQRQQQGAPRGEVPSPARPARRSTAPLACPQTPSCSPGLGSVWGRSGGWWQGLPLAPPRLWAVRVGPGLSLLRGCGVTRCMTLQAAQVRGPQPRSQGPGGSAWDHQSELTLTPAGHPLSPHCSSSSSLSGVWPPHPPLLLPAPP